MSACGWRAVGGRFGPRPWPLRALPVGGSWQPAHSPGPVEAPPSPRAPSPTASPSRSRSRGWRSPPRAPSRAAAEQQPFPPASPAPTPARRQAPSRSRPGSSSQTRGGPASAPTPRQSRRRPRARTSSCTRTGNCDPSGGALPPPVTRFGLAPNPSLSAPGWPAERHLRLPRPKRAQPPLLSRSSGSLCPSACRLGSTESA